jgi:hypothetical protein
MVAAKLELKRLKTSLLQHDYEDAFTELVFGEKRLGMMTKQKKRRLLQNSQNIGIHDTAFEKSGFDKLFIETCNFL